MSRPGSSESPDPFDFREPPAPLSGSDPPPAPGSPTRSPFEFPATDARAGRRGPRALVRAWASRARAADLSSPGAVLVGVAVLAVLILLAILIVALL